MLMILSKLYQDIKQEKIAGWSASDFHYIQKLHREETCFFVYSIYVYEIRRILANRAAARFSLGGTL